MDPIIWAALVAGGVSVIGNAATLFVARFGRDAQREQIVQASAVEIAKLRAARDTVADERRESARRERQEAYGRFLVAVHRLEDFGRGDTAGTDDEYDQAVRNFERLYAEMLLVGTTDVQEAAGTVLLALHAIGAEMKSLSGGTAHRFAAAYQQGDRAAAVVEAHAQLIYSMRQDVTAPLLPG